MKFGPKYKRFKILYLKFLFWKYISDIQIFYIRSHVPMDTVRVFFNFRFSSKKSQSQQKLAKNITHFTIQFCSKNLTNFPTCFCLALEKIFALHHIWTPKNCILGAFWKQISVYFWAYLQENFCSTDILPSIDIFRYFHL